MIEIVYGTHPLTGDNDLKAVHARSFRRRRIPYGDHETSITLEGEQLSRAIATGGTEVRCYRPPPGGEAGSGGAVGG